MLFHSAAEASCHSTCLPNAGCLGPNDPALCGSCNLVGGTFDPCAASPTPTAASRSNVGVIVGVVVAVLLVVIVVFAGLGVWVGVVCTRKWKEGRMGSFDISVSNRYQ